MSKDTAVNNLRPHRIQDPSVTYWHWPGRKPEQWRRWGFSDHPLFPYLFGLLFLHESSGWVLYNYSSSSCVNDTNRRRGALTPHIWHFLLQLKDWKPETTILQNQENIDYHRSWSLTPSPRWWNCLQQGSPQLQLNPSFFYNFVFSSSFVLHVKSRGSDAEWCCDPFRTQSWRHGSL